MTFLWDTMVMFCVFRALHTTREKRNNEKDGVDYVFVKHEQYEEDVTKVCWNVSVKKWIGLFFTATILGWISLLLWILWWLEWTATFIHWKCRSWRFSLRYTNRTWGTTKRIFQNKRLRLHKYYSIGTSINKTISFWTTMRSLVTDGSTNSRTSFAIAGFWWRWN